MKKRFVILTLAIITALNLSACKDKSVNKATEDISTPQKVETDINPEIMDTEFTDNDRNSSYTASLNTDSKADIITITDGGTYTVTGEHTQIIIDAGDTDKPKIILKNAEIYSKNGPAIYIKAADKVFITIPENSNSTLSDGSEYDTSYDNADGTIFSKADITINGNGKLNITGNYKCGIVSKDDLVVVDTDITIKSKGTAIEGKDCVKLSNPILTLDAGTDGIKSTNTEDNSLGFVFIESGNYNITAQNDGIQAESAIMISGGNFNITSGGGSAISSSNSQNNDWGMWGRPEDFQSNSSSTEDSESAKAIKCSTFIKIDGGEFNIDSSDDSVHSNGDIEINGGTITASSGDDGIHTDDQLIINSGDISISKSYEGIEATAITVTGGRLDVTASDDGFNAAGGNDSSALGGRPGQNPFESDSSAQIVINGGYILINASGDGVDSNGNININGGIVLVSGPENSGNGSLDYGTEACVNGGTVILTGASGMATTFSENSEQPSVAYTINSNEQRGTNVAVTDKEGAVLASFLPAKSYNHVIISSPSFKKGDNYTIHIGGTVSSIDKNGYTQSGSVSGSTSTYDIELSSVSTSYGSGGMGGFDGGMGGLGSPGSHGGGGKGGGRFY